MIAQTWTEEDEGLVHAVRLTAYLRYSDSLQPDVQPTPVGLEPGESHFAVTGGQVLQWTQMSVEPEEWSYFRLRVKWAKDPLMAPFLWLMLLPFNLLSRQFSKARATDTQWVRRPVADGAVILTDRRVVVVGRAGAIQLALSDISRVELRESDINIKCGESAYDLKLSPVLRAWFFVALRFLVFGDRTPLLPIPFDFYERAGALGKQLPLYTPPALAGQGTDLLDAERQPTQYVHNGPVLREDGAERSVPGFSTRFFARLIDGLITGIGVLLLARLFGGFDAGVQSLAFAILINLAYEIPMVALVGATLGKLVMRIRVVRTDGTPAGWPPSIIRCLVLQLGVALWGVGQFVLYLSPLWDSSGKLRGWHDKAAGTIVVRK
jgi:uncharacterized RDD family membrane protein YckC